MVEAFVSVWTSIVSFVTGIFSNITSVFWDATLNENAGGLTFVGTMAVIMAGVALLLLVFNLIRSFLVMRG